MTFRRYSLFGNERRLIQLAKTLFNISERLGWGRASAPQSVRDNQLNRECVRRVLP
jgi:hypothetical protein